MGSEVGGPMPSRYTCPRYQFWRPQTTPARGLASRWSVRWRASEEPPDSMIGIGLGWRAPHLDPPRTQPLHAPSLSTTDQPVPPSTPSSHFSPHPSPAGRHLQVVEKEQKVARRWSVVQCQHLAHAHPIARALEFRGDRDFFIPP